jgi:peptide/nickel transport system permease protein
MRRLRTVPASVLTTATAIVVLALVATIWPTVGLPDPIEQDLGNAFAPLGSADHLLGTDGLGRDVLSRLVHGLRNELFIAVGATVLASIVGTALGILGAFYGGIVETLTMRFVDVILSFPSVILALLVSSIYGPSVAGLIAVMGLIFVPNFARIAYGEALALKHREFVQAAAAFNASATTQMTRLILPNAIGPVIVQFSITISAAMLLESGLSFLGLGIVPPAPSLGSMVDEGQRHMMSDPTLLLIPAIAISVAVLSFSLFGDALRRRLNPKGA